MSRCFAGCIPMFACQILSTDTCGIIWDCQCQRHPVSCHRFFAIKIAFLVENQFRDTLTSRWLAIDCPTTDCPCAAHPRHPRFRASTPERRIPSASQPAFFGRATCIIQRHLNTGSIDAYGSQLEGSHFQRLQRIRLTLEVLCLKTMKTPKLVCS